jgi:hypothetical protein
MKLRRVYDLYNGTGGVSCNSINYGNPSKAVYQVVAVSIKQAYYLASNLKWYNGSVGIVAYTSCANDGWKLYNGTFSRGTPWKHYQSFSEKHELKVENGE